MGMEIDNYYATMSGAERAKILTLHAQAQHDAGQPLLADFLRDAARRAREETDCKRPTQADHEETKPQGRENDEFDRGVQAGKDAYFHQLDVERAEGEGMVSRCI